MLIPLLYSEVWEQVTENPSRRKYPEDKENTPRITIPPATQAVLGKEPCGSILVSNHLS